MMPSHRGTEHLGWRVPLHGHLGPEAFDVTEDRGDGQHMSIALEAQEALSLGS